MSRAIEVSGLKDIRDSLGLMARALRIPKVEIALTESAADKLMWLKNDGRDFTRVNAKMAADMALAFVSGIWGMARGEGGATLPWRRAGMAYRERLMQRIFSGGGDVKGSLARLSRATIERKGHSRIGYDSGKLQRDIARSRVLVAGKDVQR